MPLSNSGSDMTNIETLACYVIRLEMHRKKSMENITLVWEFFVVHFRISHNVFDKAFILYV